MTIQKITSLSLSKKTAAGTFHQKSINNAANSVQINEISAGKNEAIKANFLILFLPLL